MRQLVQKMGIEPYPAISLNALRDASKMAHELAEPEDDARAAEPLVALIARYAVRFAPVDRITFGHRSRARCYSVEVCSSMHADDMPKD